MKLRIKLGQNEIDIDCEDDRLASSVLVDWYKAVAESSGKGSGGAAGIEPESSRRNPSTKQPTRKRQTSNESRGTATDRFDPVKIVNAIRQHPKASYFDEAIINKTGNTIEKIKLIMYFSEDPSTSGDVHKCFKSMNLRATLPNLSTSIKTGIKNFTQTAARAKGGTVPKYSLTAPAKSEFKTTHSL